MSTNKELFNMFNSKLASLDFYDKYSDVLSTTWKFDKDIMSSIKLGVSDDNIKQMLELLNTKKYANALQAYGDFKSNGLLKVEPVIVDTGVPSIMLGINKYVHWFRGYYFQISSTMSGTGEVYAGADRLDIALHSVRIIRDWSCAERFITVACFIPVISYTDTGRKLLENNRGLVNKFLYMTGVYSKVVDAELNDFMDYISVVKYNMKPDRFDGLNDSESILEVRIMFEGFSYGLLQICNDRIRLLKSSGENEYSITTLTLPEWLTHDNIENKHKLYNIIVRALMSLCGFRADYMCMYPIGVKRGDTMRLDYNIPVKAEEWEDIELVIKNLID